jgi:hypothetical protein
MSSKLKQTLFRTFSTNLKNTLAQNKLTLSGNVPEIPDELYLCPISLNYFSEETLNSGDLTLEHVPPASLGGKGKVLTCKLINNADGQSSDKQFLNYFKGLIFEQHQGTLPAKISSTDLQFRGITAELSIGLNGKPRFQFITSTKNIKAMEHRKLFELWEGTNFNVTWQVQKEINQRTLLKCAYLTAFSRIGYHLLFSDKGFRKDTYGLLAEFLRSKDLPETFPVPFIPRHSPEDTPSIGMINQPFEYRSLYVNLDFHLNKHRFKYAVFLPHPLDENLDAMKNLDALIIKGNGGKPIDLKISPIPDQYLF